LSGCRVQRCKRRGCVLYDGPHGRQLRVPGRRHTVPPPDPSPRIGRYDRLARVDMCRDGRYWRGSVKLRPWVFMGQRFLAVSLASASRWCFAHSRVIHTRVMLPSPAASHPGSLQVPNLQVRANLTYLTRENRSGSRGGGFRTDISFAPSQSDCLVGLTRLVSTTSPI
jgi:hypothetical protein